VLRRQGHRRRKDHSDIREILNAIEDELETAIALSSGLRKQRARQPIMCDLTSFSFLAREVFIYRARNDVNVFKK